MDKRPLNLAAAACVVLLAVACNAAQPTGSQSSDSPPSISPEPSATASVATKFDGVWASPPLTRQMMFEAMARHGLDTSRFDELYPDFGKITYRTVEADIGSGRWEDWEFEDGAYVPGWAASIVGSDATSIVVRADDNPCGAKFTMSRVATQLTVGVSQDDCPDDLPLEVAIYEAAPLTLVQAADWQPASFTPSTPIAIGASTSADRVVTHALGTADTAPMGYLEYLPPSYSQAGAPSPLIVFLHGYGESGKGDEAGMRLIKKAGIPFLITNNEWPDDRPFVVLAPQHDSVPPNYCIEASQIAAFINFAVDSYNVDPTRIYLTGLTCGAVGIWNYLDRFGGGAIAASVPIAGNGMIAIQNHGCSLGSTPIWAFHSADDGNVPVSGEAYPITSLQACDSPAAVDAQLTVFPMGGHDVWTRTYMGLDGLDIYSWLLSHTKP